MKKKAVEASRYFLFQTSIPVPSTAAGVIEQLLVEDGSTVEAGAQLCKIRVGGEKLDIIDYCQWELALFLKFSY